VVAFYVATKQKEGDDNVAIVAFFLAIKKKIEGDNINITVAFCAATKKRQQQCCSHRFLHCVVTNQKEEGDNTNVAIAFYFRFAPTNKADAPLSSLLNPKGVQLC